MGGVGQAAGPRRAQRRHAAVAGRSACSSSWVPKRALVRSTGEHCSGGSGLSRRALLAKR